MRYKYAFYVSGNASRVIKYFTKYPSDKYKLEFIYYDGNNNIIVDYLIKKFGFERIFIFEHSAVDISQSKIGQLVSDDILYNLIKFNVDYLFCFGDRLLKPNLVDQYKYKIINFHPSILPSFKGLNAIDQALASSVQVLGNTAHFIDNGIDSGLIILQSVISRSSYIDYESVLDLQVIMLEKIWNWLDNDRIVVKENQVQILDNLNQSVLYSG